MADEYFIVERVSQGRLEIRQYFPTKESAAKYPEEWVEKNLSGHFFVAKIVMRPEVEYTINIKEV